MEPRRCRRGKPPVIISREWTNERLQWSHDDVVVENEQGIRPTQEQARLQWSHDDVVVENFRGRLSNDSRSVLQWSHDDVVVENARLAVSGSVGRYRFNGATTMSSWKTPEDEDNPYTILPLQWSHDDVVVENKIAMPEQSGWDLLQWSHDDVVVENDIRGNVAHGTPPQLQWSHDDVVVENPPPKPEPIVAHPCFNGATTMSSWKTRKGRSRGGGMGGLQWSHDDVVVENQ